MNRLSDGLSRLQSRFRNTHGYELNLEHPQTLMEKIQWLKLYGGLERFAKYVDKYEVREFVKQKLGEEYLIPLIGVYNSTNQISFSSLPNSFVMKATHGSGWNVIVNDKSAIDWPVIRQQMNNWLSMNYYDISGEPNYRPLKGRVLIEEYLDDCSEGLIDYRIFCFHGMPRCIQVEQREERQDLYDLNWTRLPARFCDTPSFQPTLQRPANLQGMIAVSERLSESFPFVRVDLYYTNGQIYFGELTFTPSNGFARVDPVDFDLELGRWLDLTRG